MLNRVLGVSGVSTSGGGRGRAPSQLAGASGECLKWGRWGLDSSPRGWLCELGRSSAAVTTILRYELCATKFVNSVLDIFENPLQGPPTHRIPKPPQQQKKSKNPTVFENPTTKRYFPLHFPKSKRYSPKSKRYLPKSKR